VDSGIHFRGSPRYQVNIRSQPMGSGDINDLHKDAALSEAVRRAWLPRPRTDAPLGQWNRFVITLHGSRATGPSAVSTFNPLDTKYQLPFDATECIR
jgi:hypothetical protein